MITHAKGGFQYPLRVEVGCNRRMHVTCHCRPEVSVPSTGRSGLQHATGVGDAVGEMRFSTLYGSKWVATFRISFSILCPSEFQYPLRVEVGCNWIVDGLQAHGDLRFSTLYGSKWVATIPEVLLIHVYAGFSTLYGSKWVATGYKRRTSQKWRVFQYPLRVEVGCNPLP